MRRTCERLAGLVLATGWGNPPVVWILIRWIVRFGFRPVQKSDLHLVGGPIPDPDLSPHGFLWVWLDLLVQISSTVHRVSLFMVAFRHSTDTNKIVTLVWQYNFEIYWLHLWPKQTGTWSLPNPGNARQRNVDHVLSLIVCNQSVDCCRHFHMKYWPCL